MCVFLFKFSVPLIVYYKHKNKRDKNLWLHFFKKDNYLKNSQKVSTNVKRIDNFLDRNAFFEIVN